MHDVLGALWRNRRTLRIRGRVSTYLRSAVRNRCLNQLERESRRVSWREDGKPVPARAMVEPHSPDDDIYRAELLEILRDALDDLTPERREALQLLARHFDRREIAQALGISVAAVDQRLSRGRRDLAPLREWLHARARMCPDDPSARRGCPGRSLRG